jgi:hypothetical protein
LQRSQLRRWADCPGDRFALTWSSPSLTPCSARELKDSKSLA